MLGNRIQQQHQQQQQDQQQQRRKWSDWSRCSFNCLQTRHRLNCDDILATQNTTTQQTTTATTSAGSKLTSASANSSSSKQQKQADTTTGSGKSKLEEEEELLLKADQIDDDDYADEGDEEDEADSCANVDTTKTLEERICTGGECRLPALNALDKSQLTTLPTTPIVRQRTRNRINQSRLRNGQNQNQFVPNLVIREKVPSLVTGDKSQDAITATAIATNIRLDNGVASSSGRQMSRFHHKSSASTNSSGDNSVTQLRDSQANANATNNELGSSSKVASGAIWSTTRSMWPQQLLDGNGDLGAQANLVQWTILIGSLLTLILLMLLILRKLFLSTFPSYHWMLAKQTIKSSPNNQFIHGLPKECCHHRVGAAMIGAQPASGGEGTIQVIQAADGSSQAHRMCYSWRPNPAQPVQSAAQGAYQYVIDATGRHLLAGSSSLPDQNGAISQQKYNNQSANRLLVAHMQPEEPHAQFTTTTAAVGYLDARSLEASSHHSSGSRRHTNGSKGRRMNANETSSGNNEGRNSVISNDYNYDTLNSSCYEQVEEGFRPNDKGFLLTRDFIAFSQNPTANLVGGSHSRRPKDGSDDAIAGQQSIRQQRQSENIAANQREAKHGSANATSKGALDRGNQHEPSIEDSSSSRSSSIASGSNGSPSVQSTTAQMLSNAASSSFEQQPELAECSTTPMIVSNPLHNSQAAVSGSPASLGAGKQRYNQAKITFLEQTVQSQPNSPMLSANQTTFFGASRSAATSAVRCKTTNVRPTTKLQPNRQLQRSCNSHDVTDDGDADYAQPEQTEPFQGEQSEARMQKCSPIRGKTVLRLARELEAAGGVNCDSDDRHYYEEISQHK